MLKENFGFCGTINPPVEAVTDTIHYGGGVVISIHDGVFEVTYNDANDERLSRKIAADYLNAWSFRNNLQIDVDFNQSWRPNPNGNRAISVLLNDSISLSDRVIITTTQIKGMAYIVRSESDSHKFSNDTSLVQKAQRDETLSLALTYFHDEVLDKNQDQNGMHKAVEQILNHINPNNGRAARVQLAQMAGVTVLYIKELTESVQEKRHSKAWRILKGNQSSISKEECVVRTKKLIQAYADFLIT